LAEVQRVAGAGAAGKIIEDAPAHRGDRALALTAQQRQIVDGSVWGEHDTRSLPERRRNKDDGGADGGRGRKTSAYHRRGRLSFARAVNIGAESAPRNLRTTHRDTPACAAPRDWRKLVPISGGSRQETIMTGTVESKLAELGIALPTPAAPVANYVGFVRSGRLLVLSGQLCLGDDGKLVAQGKLGGGVSVDDGQKAARACAVNLLAQAKAALGDLDKVNRVVRLGGLKNPGPSLPGGPKAMKCRVALVVAGVGGNGRHVRTPPGGTGA